jgi:enoyl-CoA hydratase/carnithine racemase
VAELLVTRPAAGVALLTLNRPDQLNAVTLELQRALDAALGTLEADASIGCVVLTGAGARAFSAGYDVHEMSGWSADELLLRMLEREPLVWRLASTRLPIIAALNGITYGIGAVLATAVDIRFGCPATVLRFTSGEHGGANATWSLPGLVGRGRAAELLMTGRKLGVEEAERIGLLDRVVAERALIDEAVATAATIAGHPPTGMSAIKRLIREGAGRSVEQAYVAENLAMRTELRPRPVGELYAEFLGERAGR